jgi:hypothetical protein
VSGRAPTPIGNEYPSDVVFDFNIHTSKVDRRAADDPIKLGLKTLTGGDTTVERWVGEDDMDRKKTTHRDA